MKRRNYRRIAYYQGRQYRLFNGRTMRTFHVWQWSESTTSHHEMYDKLSYYS